MQNRSTIVTATKFKAKCLALIDQMNSTKVPIIVTKRGKPVAELKPISSQSKQKAIFGSMKNRIKIEGDIMTPVAGSDEWEALR